MLHITGTITIGTDKKETNFITITNIMTQGGGRGEKDDSQEESPLCNPTQSSTV